MGLEDKVRELKDAVRRQEKLAEEFRVAPFQNNSPETWAYDVWARMSDSERHYFKETLVKGSKGLNRRLIGKKEAVKRLQPIVTELKEVGMESSGDKLIGALFDLLNEWCA